MIIGMVIGHSGMGDACRSQTLGPLGFASKNKVLVDGSCRICKRAFEVDYHSIGLTKYGIDTCEKGGDAFALGVGPHATIKEHVAGEDKRQRVLLSCFLLRARNKKNANNQSYTG